MQETIKRPEVKVRRFIMAILIIGVMVTILFVAYSNFQFNRGYERGVQSTLSLQDEILAARKDIDYKIHSIARMFCWLDTEVYNEITQPLSRLDFSEVDTHLPSVTNTQIYRLRSAHDQLSHAILGGCFIELLSTAQALYDAVNDIRPTVEFNFALYGETHAFDNLQGNLRAVAGWRGNEWYHDLDNIAEYNSAAINFNRMILTTETGRQIAAAHNLTPYPLFREGYVGDIHTSFPNIRPGQFY